MFIIFPYRTREDRTSSWVISGGKFAISIRLVPSPAMSKVTVAICPVGYFYLVWPPLLEVLPGPFFGWHFYVYLPSYSVDLYHEDVWIGKPQRFINPFLDVVCCDSWARWVECTHKCVTSFSHFDVTLHFTSSYTGSETTLSAHTT
jgi:hypothetical protein